MPSLNKKTSNVFRAANAQKKSGMVYHKVNIEQSALPKDDKDIIFVGLDLSIKNTGLCIKEHDKDFYLLSIPTENLPVNTRYKKFLYIWTVIKNELDKLDKNKTIIFCIELYAMFGSSVVQLAELGGFVRTKLTELKYQFLDLEPTSVKMFATGNGRADKLLVVQKMSNKLGITFSNDDEADAAAMCSYLIDNIGKIRSGRL